MSSRGARRLVWLLALLAFFGSGAMARTIKIVQASRLELRNVTLPDGTIEEYIIFSGSPAILLVDEDEVSGERLEYNKTRRKLRIVGAGSFKSKTESIAGRDFEVDLELQGLQGSDVFIATNDIDIVGISCQRLPGQLEVQSGYFSPCARCGKSEDAYGFKAGNITLYPGDRLIARDVQILVGGVPAFYLPIVVIFLNDPGRQPRLDINTNAPSDGVTIAADLPFTVSDFGLGFTLLRYFEKRTPAFGFGIDLTLFDLFGGTNRTRAFFLALPPIDKSNTGVQLAYQLNARGEIPLTGTVDTEDERSPLKFEINVNRVDSAINTQRDLRGVTGENKRTNFSIKLNLETLTYTMELETRGFIDHRDSPIPGDAQSLASYNAGLPGLVQYQPEFRFTARDALLPKLGPFSLTAWGFTAGIITAPYDALNTSARRLAGDGPYVSAGKFSANWALGLDFTPWQDGRVNGSTNFRGQYYSTTNPDSNDPTQPGEYERNINLSINLGFQQTLFSNAVRFNANYAYSISEGESPFAFDRVGVRPPSSSLALGLQAAPLPWLNFGANQNSVFTRVANPLDPLSVSLGLSPAPLSANLSASYDWKTGQPVGYSVSLQNNVLNGLNFSVQTGYRFFDPLNAGFVPAWDDLRFNVGFRSPDNGRFSVSLGLTQNLNNGEIRNWGLNSTLILGTNDAPVTLSFNQTLTPPQYSNIAPNAPQVYSRLNGGFSVRLQNLTFSFDDALDFTPYTYSVNAPIPNSRIGITASGTEPLPWSVRFGSAVDLSKEGLEFYQPTLTGNIGSRSETQGGAFEFSLSFQLLLPWRNQPDWRFSSATLSSAWDVFPGFSIFSSITYSRTVSNGIFRDRFNLNPIGFTFAFSEGDNPRPSVFLSVFLRGTYEFSDAPGSNLPLFTPPPSSTGSGGTPFISDLRPIFVLTFDECCYSLIFTFDSTPQAGINFSFSIGLPFGKQDIIVDSPTDGVRFPFLPFIPPITRNP